MHRFTADVIADIDRRWRLPRLTARQRHCECDIAASIAYRLLVECDIITIKVNRCASSCATNTENVFRKLCVDGEDTIRSWRIVR